MTFFKSVKVSDKDKQFRRIFDRFYADLLRFAKFKISDDERAEDLVQETFMRLWNQFDQPDTDPKKLLFTILNNLIIDEYRKKKFDIIDSDNIDIERSESNTMNTLFQLVEELPDDLQTIFIMNKYSQFKYSEIAEILAISVKTVEAKMSKALKFLKEHKKT